MSPLFRSQDLPKNERFAWWYEMASQAHVRTIINSAHEADFHATMQVLDLGAVQVSALTYPSLRASRTQKLIRQSDPEYYHISLTRRGHVSLSQAGRNAVLGPAHLVLYDTSRPCVVFNPEPIAQTVLQVPRRLLVLHPRVLGRLIAAPLPTHRGLGALVRRFIVDLIGYSDDYRPADMAGLLRVVLGLLAALYADEADDTSSIPTETRKQVMQTRIHDFIERRLSDPALAPARIAAAHQISTRYLHLLFQEQGLTVLGWIRQRRLERCRQDLADPALDSRPVHAIGARWGFPDATSFSRAFRQAHGLPPGDYRRRLREES